MYGYKNVEKEIDNIKRYIEEIVISNYKNCFFPEKLDILSNLYFFYEKAPKYIWKQINKENNKPTDKEIKELIENIRLKVITLKFSLMCIEKNHKNTDETILFTDYIAQNKDLLELYLEQNILKLTSIDNKIQTLKAAM